MIIADVNSAKGGFPSLIHDDPLLDLVRTKDSSFKHAGERRVFYVGITRARLECHVISSIEAPSTFALEFYNSRWGKHEGFDESKVSNCPACKTGWLTRNEKLSGLGCTNWPVCSFRTPPCPECGHPMRVRDGQPGAYICEKHPNTENEKCPSCSWGALIEKNSVKGPFLGCHLWISTKCKGSRDLFIEPWLGFSSTVIEASDIKEFGNYHKDAVTDVESEETSVASRKGKLWTRKEDLSLIEAYLAKVPRNEIASQFGRTPGAVRARIIHWVEMTSPRLTGKPIRKSAEYSQNGKTWADGELRQLEELWDGEFGIVEICDKLERPKAGVLQKLLELNLVPITNETKAVVNRQHDDAKPWHQGSQ